jgi:hypothetical protein
VEVQLRILIVVALTGLIILLRFDAARFQAAEYDDDLAPGGWRVALRRLTWYALGVVLAVAIFRLHPTPVTTLHLSIGDDRTLALIGGLAFGALGVLVAVTFAWLRYRRFRLPEMRLYPGAILNSVFTAFIDEVAFRGALLGLLLTIGSAEQRLPPELALMFQAYLYGLATRLGAPGRSWPMLVIFLGVGTATGWLALATGGIAAGVLAHAITRFAVFVCTGHPGQIQPVGAEPEEVMAERLPPDGWEVVREGEY